MKPQSMGGTLAAMEEEGLVERRPHPTDRRQILFTLTADERPRNAEESRTLPAPGMVVRAAFMAKPVKYNKPSSPSGRVDPKDQRS